MSKSLYLGIDLGTSGVRCAVVDEAGHERAQAQVRYPAPAGPIVDAEDWWRATEACLDQQIENLQVGGLSPGDIRALAIDGTSVRWFWWMRPSGLSLRGYCIIPQGLMRRPK